VRTNDRGQVALLKVVVFLAVFAFVAVDLGRPLVGRVSLDTDAHSVAAVSADDWRAHHDRDSAQQAATQEAAKGGSTVTTWDVRESDGTVTLTIEKTLHSWFFGRYLKRWYTASATASERSGS
jgi:hypothetical protein